MKLRKTKGPFIVRTSERERIVMSTITRDKCRKKRVKSGGFRPAQKDQVRREVKSISASPDRKSNVNVLKRDGRLFLKIEDKYYPFTINSVRNQISHNDIVVVKTPGMSGVEIASIMKVLNERKNDLYSSKRD